MFPIKPVFVIDPRSDEMLAPIFVIAVECPAIVVRHALTEFDKIERFVALAYNELALWKIVLSEERDALKRLPCVKPKNKLLDIVAPMNPLFINVDTDPLNALIDWPIPVI